MWPILFMYDIFRYIYLHGCLIFMFFLSKYTISGWYGWYFMALHSTKHVDGSLRCHETAPNLYTSTYLFAAFNVSLAFFGRSVLCACNWATKLGSHPQRGEFIISEVLFVYHFYIPINLPSIWVMSMVKLGNRKTSCQWILWQIKYRLYPQEQSFPAFHGCD